MKLRAIQLSVCLTLVGGQRILAQSSYWVDVNNCPGPGDGTLAEPFCTIAQGIAAAPPGTFVRVMPGTYSGPGNVNLDFAGKEIRLWGVSAGVIIDGQNANRILHLHSGETNQTDIAFLTLRNGRAPEGENGGAVLIEGSSPSIRGCRIETSHALNGGGIFIDGDTPGHSTWLEFVDFLNNTCIDEGGGLHVNAASPQMTACMFMGNHSNGYGGGAYLASPVATVTRCPVLYNTAHNGAGMFVRSGTLVIDECTFLANSATNAGGGINLETSDSAIIRNGVFFSNNAQLAGGGLYTATGAPIITNGLFILNQSIAGNGGGIHINSGNPSMTNCTVADNNAAFLGGGIYHQNSNTTIVNTIIWRNVPQQISLAGAGVPAISYSNIQGGWTGTGNLNADPRFGAGYANAYALRQFSTGHFDQSPCVDAGTSTDESTPMLMRTTRRDQVADALPVDMGYHAWIFQTAYPIPPGDHNFDGKLDLLDFHYFQTCYSGADVERDLSCWRVDFDTDYDVDDDDFADWAQWLTGP